MSGTSDKITGKVKQAAGDLTDDDQLRREGKADEASGEVKDKLDEVKDKVEGAVDKVKDKIHRN